MHFFFGYVLYTYKKTSRRLMHTRINVEYRSVSRAAAAPIRFLSLHSSWCVMDKLTSPLPLCSAPLSAGAAWSAKPPSPVPSTGAAPSPRTTGATAKPVVWSAASTSAWWRSVSWFPVATWAHSPWRHSTLSPSPTRHTVPDGVHSLFYLLIGSDLFIFCSERGWNDHHVVLI